MLSLPLSKEEEEEKKKQAPEYGVMNQQVAHSQSK